jgi:hypothetical protein
MRGHEIHEEVEMVGDSADGKRVRPESAHRAPEALVEFGSEVASDQGFAAFGREDDVVMEGKVG